MHELYENQRLFSNTGDKEYLKLQEEMFALSSTLTTPNNIEGVEQR